MENLKIKMLANELKIQENEVEQRVYDKNIFKIGNKEYLIVAEKEKEEELKYEISKNLWKLDTDFILGHINIVSNEKIENLF